MKLKILAVCLAACLSNQVLAKDLFTIKDIRIEGLQRTEPATIFSYLPIKVGDQFTDIKGEQVIKDLFATGFFDDVQVETFNNQVLLTVVERPVISTLTVTGGKMISNDDIRKNLSRMGLAQSKIYNPVLMNRVIEGLKHEYAGRGKNEANVIPQLTQLDRNRVAIEIKVEEGDTTTIKEINFEGNQHFSTRKLRNQIQTSKTGIFSWLSRDDRFAAEKFSGDLQDLDAFYKENGYFDFKILDTAVKPNETKQKKLNINIKVDEGERYKWGNISIEGDTKEVPLADLQKSLKKIKPGKWYNQALLQNAIAQIKGRMGEAGYGFADVQIIPTPHVENKTLDFILTVVPQSKLYVNRINISGNNKTRDEVVRRELRQAESAPYNSKNIMRSKERIELLGYFDNIEVKQRSVDGAPDQVDVDVSVNERPTGNVNVSVGYVQDDGIVFGGGISQDNLFGTGKSANLRVSTGGTNKVGSLSFTDPYFTADGVSLGYDFFWRSYKPYKSDKSSYETETYGANIRMGVPITEYDRINFGLGANQMKIKTSDYSPQQYIDFINKYGSKNWTLTGNIGWGRNTTDSALWPTRGYIINANADLGLPGGDIQYYKLMHEQNWFFPISKNLTLMLAGRLGYANGYGKTDELPFFHNITGGGLGSVRGYESGSLGPKVYERNDQYSDSNSVNYMGGTKEASMTAEVLFPLPGIKNQRSVRFSLFADAGSIWDGKTYGSADGPYKKTHTSSFKEELRYSAGLAFTWLSPMGPMKFSYAVPLRKRDGDEVQRFQFQLGTVF